MIYVFEDYELDTQRYELRRRGVLCPLEPQGFNVLVYLVQHCNRVVCKEELFAQLWPNQTVELFRNKRWARLSSKTMEGAYRWGYKSAMIVR